MGGAVAAGPAPPRVPSSNKVPLTFCPPPPLWAGRGAARRTWPLCVGAGPPRAAAVT